MEKTRAELERERGVANQQRLVELLTPQRNKPVKHVIPGGKNMLEELDGEALIGAVYNWLRRVSKFGGITISFAKDAAVFQTAKEKVIDFPGGTQPIWLTHPKGRMYLAEEFTKIIKSTKLVAIEADKTGIYVIKDRSNKFGPKRAAGAADATDKIAIGDLIPNEDWEPYLEFRDVERPRYGR